MFDIQKICLSLFLVTASGLSAAAQLLPYGSEFRSNGWPIPTTKKLKIRNTVSKEVDGGIFLEQDFEVTKLELSTVLSKERDVEKYCEFRNLRAFSYKDKMFAVSGGCVIFYISIYKATKGKSTLRVKHYMGAFTQYTFYDEDGDGKFERRYNSSPGDKKFEILIPDWARK